MCDKVSFDTGTQRNINVLLLVCWPDVCPEGAGVLSVWEGAFHRRFVEVGHVPGNPMDHSTIGSRVENGVLL